MTATLSIVVNDSCWCGNRQDDYLFWWLKKRSDSSASRRKTAMKTNTYPKCVHMSE